MIHVVAEIHLAPGALKFFLEEFHRLVPQVRAEDGCIEYIGAIDKATDVAAAAPHRKDLVTVVEKWRDVPSLDRHLVAHHMLVYRKRTADLIRTVTVHVMEGV